MKHSTRVVHTTRFNRIANQHAKTTAFKHPKKPVNPWMHPRFSFLTNALLVLLSTGLMVVSAKISVPVQPVPVTLQPLAILFVAMICGWRIAVIAVLFYLALGFAVLSLFAKTDYMLMWGYFAGSVLAAAVTGFLTERGWACHIFSSIVAALLGLLILQLCGWAVLAHSLGMLPAFHEGVRPFILFDALTILFLAALVPAFWRFYVAANKAAVQSSLHH